MCEPKEPSTEAGAPGGLPESPSTGVDIGARPSPAPDLKQSATASNIKEQEKSIHVAPTGPEGKYSDVSLTALLATQVANVNAGKVLIWQRYNMMLATNALLLGFLAKEAPPTEHAAVGWMLAGVVFCTLWFAITVASWSHNMRNISYASRFEWDPSALGTTTNPNPLSRANLPVIKRDWDRYGWYRDWIFVAAVGVIVLCASVHVGLCAERWWF